MTNTNRYILSSAVTFLATFFTVLGSQLTTSGAASLTSSALAGLALVAVRAAFKAVIEGFAGNTGDVQA